MIAYTSELLTAHLLLSNSSKVLTIADAGDVLNKGDALCKICQTEQKLGENKRVFSRCVYVGVMSKFVSWKNQ